MKEGKREAVLVIEENELDRDLLGELIADRYTVLKAENSMQGLEILREHAAVISAVILDMEMPEIHGYDFLAAVKKDPALMDIPVLVIAEADMEEENRCIQAGAADFVPVPYHGEILKCRIASIIRLREEEETVYALRTDEDTGLYTKQAFFHYAAETLARNPENAYALLMINPEHINMINEYYGMEAGDRILRQIAQTLRKRVAAEDVYGRFDGAKFAVLHKQEKGEDISTWVRNLLIDLQDDTELKKISLKAGIVRNVDPAVPVEVLCGEARAAMKMVGPQYEDRFAFYDKEIEARQIRAAMLESEMQEAYDKKQFAVYYQPKHDALTGKLVGAEALLRWIHPEYGVLSPGEFIPLMEKNGFIAYADYYVWNRTCENLHRWTEEGIPVVPVSVNASRRDFEFSDCVERISIPVKENDLDPSLMHIEVTETFVAEDAEEMCRKLRQCRKLGYQIEMDDFGAGYSSLNLLASLPLDVLKLDMSFMRNYTNPRKRKVLAACIFLADDLGLKTVCEGVETKEQLKLLQRLGCNYVQGYYYSKPLPEDEFRAYLRQQV